MTQVTAVLYCEYKIRTSNHLVMSLYALCLPMAYLLVFGVGLAGLTHNQVTWRGAEMPYVAFVLAGVLSGNSVGTALGAAWGFFTDRDNGIYYEFLTYPIGRGQFLFGKIMFNDLVAIGRASLTALVAALVLKVEIKIARFPLL